MRFFRILFAFLFVRNWYSGEWEVSRPRAVIFAAIMILLFVACAIILLLQAPVTYKTVL